MVTSFGEIPRSAERVIFFPRAAGGARAAPGGRSLIPTQSSGG
jgi:hypothetical protein